MKKLFVTLGFLLVTTSMFAITVKITKDGGGTCGYEKVVEEHNANRSTLDCSKPGNEKCTWEYPPKLAISIKQVTDIIETNIQNGFIGTKLFIQELNIFVVLSNISISSNGVLNYTAEFELL
jgi:hypothetical protein